ncbi:aldo/keto reductase [Nonomuraea sp. 10N515B]|uniref:aldo/keto reductase n=1 Tax=Nonomuraea sp. 10N515B TaxID=3457422 RepID=UPI003FCD7F23
MNTRRLGTTDFEITPIGLGSQQFADVGKEDGKGPDQDTVQSIVRAALDGGINWFDTAELYGQGRAERAITTALHALGVGPGKVMIATKWSPVGRRASHIVRSVDDRLAALQGYPIDDYQIHFPYGSVSGLDSQVRAMATLAKEHKISAVGVSNFSTSQMEKASEILRSEGLALASNQVQISLLHRKIDRNGMLDAARRLGVTLIAYMPLRSGLLAGKFHDDPSRAAGAGLVQRRMLGLNDKGLARTRPLIEELRAIAQAYGASPSQVALAWLVQFYGDTVVAIPGASKPHQAEEISAVLDLRLTDNELTRFDDLSRQCGG